MSLEENSELRRGNTGGRPRGNRAEAPASATSRGKPGAVGRWKRQEGTAPRGSAGARSCGCPDVTLPGARTARTASAVLDQPACEGRPGQLTATSEGSMSGVFGSL